MKTTKLQRTVDALGYGADVYDPAHDCWIVNLTTRKVTKASRAAEHDQVGVYWESRDRDAGYIPDFADMYRVILGSRPRAVTEGSAPDFGDKANTLPVRTRVANWKLGECKLCLTNDVNNGDTIVRVHGVGWWHDRCFKRVRPDLYVDIPAAQVG